MRDYRKYDIWIDGVDFSVKIYEVTNTFPEPEKFGIVSQLRRSAISIPSNFAEGCSRTSEKDFRRFLEIALGSAFEIETQLIISNKLGYLENDVLDDLIVLLDKISKQLNSLRNKLK